MNKPDVKTALDGLHKALVANQDFRIDYFDVKYLNEEVHHLRGEVKKLISSYKLWVRSVEQQRDVKVLLLANRRTDTMRANVTEMLSFYREVRMLRNFYVEIYKRQNKIK